MKDSTTAERFFIPFSVPSVVLVEIITEEKRNVNRKSKKRKREKTMRKFIEETTNLETATINTLSAYAESERRILRIEGYKYVYTNDNTQKEIWKKY